MWLVKYLGKAGITYRRYKNMEQFQVERIANSYAKRHKLTWASIVKEY